MFSDLFRFSYEVQKSEYIILKCQNHLTNVDVVKEKESNVKIVLTSISGGIHISVDNSFVPYLMLGWVSNEKKDIQNLTIFNGNKVINISSVLVISPYTFSYSK